MQVTPPDLSKHTRQCFECDRFEPLIDVALEAHEVEPSFAVCEACALRLTEALADAIGYVVEPKAIPPDKPRRSGR